LDSSTDAPATLAVKKAISMGPRKARTYRYGNLGSTGNVRRRDFITLFGCATAAWSALARAQKPVKPVVAYMSARSPEDSVAVLKAFHQGLAENGFIEGQNVTIEYRWARGDYSRLPTLAAELVRRRVDVLVGAGGDSSARAAKAATSTIPVVFVMGGDPIKAGIVQSFNLPGGNATGCVIFTDALEPKRLSLLNELVPGKGRLAAILDPKFPPAAGQMHNLEQAAPKIGRQLLILKASNDTELDAAFATLLREKVVALLVASDPFFDTRLKRFVAFASQHRLPAIYQFRQYAVAGGLMSYGPSLPDAYRQAGTYVGRILKGAKPADLPVLQSAKFDFVINLRTANALGLTLSPLLLTRADEVIE
jgi:putative ABC transport system substrate-binding protein